MLFVYGCQKSQNVYNVFCLFVCFLLIRFIFRKKVATDLFKRCFVELKDC